MRTAREAGADALEDVAAFDEYVGPQVGAGKKSVALAVILRRSDRTMTDAEADASVNVIVVELRDTFGAVLRGPAGE